MKKQMHRLLSLMLSLILVVGLIPGTALTAAFAVETPTITITGLTAPQAGQSAEEWLDSNSPVFNPDVFGPNWVNGPWYEGAFDNYGEMMSYTDGEEFWWNFAPGQSYTLDLAVLSETPILPQNATVNVPGATSAVYVYWGEGFEGWYYADILIVYTVGYEVSFDANGGTGTMIPAEVKEGEEYTLPENGFTAPSNKAFKAWSVGGEEKQPGDKITVSANTTVTAVWQDLVKYDLWVGGVQVTNNNAGNITGEGITGAVSYDPTTKTLTLNNATITGAHEFSIFDDVGGIYGKETLTINLIGNNTITGSDNGGSSYGIHIDYNGNLTFTGTGSLTVSAADLSENNWSVAVFAEGSITVEESCTITAYCGTNAWVASAFYSYANDNKYVLPNVPGVLVAGNKNAPNTTNLEVCNNNLDRFQYVRIAPGYTVTLNKVGGTINSGNVTCYFVDTGATLPTEVTKANSIFGGWYDNAECTGTAITEIPASSTGEKEYWAKWTTIHTCSIEPVEKVWPDCENGGKEAYYKCKGCGKFFEDADGETEIDDIDAWGILETIDHTPSNWKSDSENHWKECTAENCNAEIEGTKAAHTSTGANEANCQREATCDVCGATYGDVGDHAPVNAWSKYDDGHWHACSTPGCSEMIGFEAHIDEDEDGICDTCSYEEEVTEDPEDPANPGTPEDPENPENPEDSETPEDPESTEDEEAPESTEKPEESQKPADNKNPQTGDNTQLGLWIALLIVSSFGIVAITLFGKKKYSAR